MSRSQSRTFYPGQYDKALKAITSIAQGDHYAQHVLAAVDDPDDRSISSVRALWSMVPPFAPNPLDLKAFTTKDFEDPSDSALVVALSDYWLPRRGRMKEGLPAFTHKAFLSSNEPLAMPSKDAAAVLEALRLYRINDMTVDPAESENLWTNRQPEFISLEYDSVDGVDHGDGFQESGKSRVAVSFGRAGQLRKLMNDFKADGKLEVERPSITTNYVTPGHAGLYGPDVDPASVPAAHRDLVLRTLVADYEQTADPTTSRALHLLVLCGVFCLSEDGAMAWQSMVLERISTKDVKGTPVRASGTESWARRSQFWARLTTLGRQLWTNITSTNSLATYFPARHCAALQSYPPYVQMLKLRQLGTFYKRTSKMSPEQVDAIQTEEDWQALCARQREEFKDKTCDMTGCPSHGTAPPLLPDVNKYTHKYTGIVQDRYPHPHPDAVGLVVCGYDFDTISVAMTETDDLDEIHRSLRLPKQLATYSRQSDTRTTFYNLEERYGPLNECSGGCSHQYLGQWTNSYGAPDTCLANFAVCNACALKWTKVTFNANIKANKKIFNTMTKAGQPINRLVHYVALPSPPALAARGVECADASCHRHCALFWGGRPVAGPYDAAGQRVCSSHAPVVAITRPMALTAGESARVYDALQVSADVPTLVKLATEFRGGAGITVSALVQSIRNARSMLNSDARKTVDAWIRTFADHGAA